jgi:hypothetical protein
MLYSRSPLDRDASSGPLASLTDIASGSSPGVHSYNNTTSETECKCCSPVRDFDLAVWIGMVVCVELQECSRLWICVSIYELV